MRVCDDAKKAHTHIDGYSLYIYVWKTKKTKTEENWPCYAIRVVKEC